MDKIMLSAIVVTVIILGTAAAGLTGHIDIQLGDDDEDPGIKIISFNETHAFQHAEALYYAGPRAAGTDGELAGATYIYDQFVNASLYNPYIEEFTETLYEVNDAYLYAGALTDSIIIDEEYEHTRDFVVLGYSGSTSGEETFDVVYVENGTDDAYDQSGNVAGMAVLVLNDGTIGSSQIYMQAINHSAAAVMQYNPDREDPISKTAAFTDSDGQIVALPDYFPDAELIPYLMLSAAAGEDLRDAAESVNLPGEYCEVDIDFDVTVDALTSYNVVGDIKGKSKDLVIIGAHMDTVYCGRGALDNTVGATIVTQLAYSLADYHPGKTIRLIAFGSEEAGIFGSQAYVEEHLDDLKGRLDFMINLDMTDIDLDSGNALPLRPSTEGHLKGLNKTSKKFFSENPELGENYTVSLAVAPGTVGSDHRSFYMEGFDVCAAWGNHGEGYHSPDDVIENMNPESWPVIGGIIGSYALYLANR